MVETDLTNIYFFRIFLLYVHLHSHVQFRHHNKTQKYTPHPVSYLMDNKVNHHFPIFSSFLVVYLSLLNIPTHGLGLLVICKWEYKENPKKQLLVIYVAIFY
nr:MAG TPA: hypothetical protein [Caudoviricetes sp.]